MKCSLPESVLHMLCSVPRQVILSQHLLSSFLRTENSPGGGVPGGGPGSLGANQAGLLEWKLATLLVAAVAGPGPE